MFLMCWVGIVGGRRDITACRMRAKVSFRAVCLPAPGNPCCTSAVWRGGEGAGDDREMAPL